MNGFSRYAHNLTPFRTMMSFFRWKLTNTRPVENWTVAWDDALNRIRDESVKTKLQEFHSRVTMLVIGQLVLSPGFLLVALVPFTVFVIIHRQWTTLRKIYSDVREKIPMSFLEEEAANS
jgi:hypothetical protein